MHRFFLIFIITLSSLTLAFSQSSTPVLMALSAHPDDEDGATLAYYARLKGVKTYSVFYTRGEGGQNEIGSQLGDELGVLRTKETLEAAQILGSEVVFLGFPDFGFSKTAKETFSMWGGYDSVLARIVYVIRALKPDILISNHDTIQSKPNRQHGNHQAVGITAYAAVQKAADASYHPEQLNDVVTTWQVKKLFFRFLNRGPFAKDSLVAIDVSKAGNSGESIEQLSLDALAKHRSQGMDKFTLDSIPTFFRQHKYSRIYSDKEYPFDPADLFSGIVNESRTVLNAGTIQFPRVVLQQPKVNNPERSKAIVAKDCFIGLIATYDKTIEQTLRAFHIQYDLLDSAKLANANLQLYTAILLDLRGYEYRTDAALYNTRLFKYAEEGGHFVSFYHKQGDWNGKNLVPYPLSLTNERVTEEDAAVKILDPSHRLFTTPNQITENDWSDWAQERSIYLPSDDTVKTSAKYERLLAMSDADEQQPSTSLLYATYGKGSYSYVSLALYRQLRNFNEGALKLFFNLISQSNGQ